MEIDEIGKISGDNDDKELDEFLVNGSVCLSSDACKTACLEMSSESSSGS